MRQVGIGFGLGGVAGFCKSTVRELSGLGKKHWQLGTGFCIPGSFTNSGMKDASCMREAQAASY